MLSKDNEHVYYEWTMLQNCYNALKTVVDQFSFNVLHESFCVHANNLINDYIMLMPNGEVKKIVSPEEITGINHILDMIRNQVLTLTDKRTAVYEEKIGPGGQRDKLYEFIKKFMAP